MLHGIVCDRNNIGSKPDLVSGIYRKGAYKGMPKNGQNGLSMIARKDAYTGWPIRLVFH